MKINCFSTNKVPSVYQKLRGLKWPKLEPPPKTFLINRALAWGGENPVYFFNFVKITSYHFYSLKEISNIEQGMSNVEIKNILM